MYRCLTILAASVALLGGCAHHQANQYAYAPPLAPPVYPQPQTVAQPVAGPTPGPVAGAPVLPAAPVTGMPLTTAGVVTAGSDGACPPCAGESAAVPVAYEGAIQTAPCPQ